MSESAGHALGALIDAGKEVVVPVLKDMVGIAGGDWLHHIRTRMASRLEIRTKQILKERGVEDNFAEVSPAFIQPLVEAATNETREELLELWARLLAAAADPGRAATVRKSFVSALQQFDPIDALVFKELWDIGFTTVTPTKRDEIARRLKVGMVVVQVSFENLFRQRCVVNPSGGPDPGADPALSSFGQELARTLFA